ncbi:type II secretion system protein [bacterium]|nr:type II secretion system protein [bacterium]
MKRRGMTLLEVLIYVIMAGMASMAVGALFSLGRKAQGTMLAGYLVSGQTDTALRWIRQDLQETALTSITTYPNASQAAQPPGCSFVSPREPGGAFQTSVYARPRWVKFVLYSLRDQGDGRRGELIRWELPFSDAQKDFVPHTCATLPNAFTENKYRRVLVKDVLLPNQKVPNLKQNPDYQTGPNGGFRVLFVQRAGSEAGAETLTSVNPGDNTVAQKPADHHTLVDVRLEILSDDKFYPSFYQIGFKVHPKY